MGTHSAPPQSIAVKNNPLCLPELVPNQPTRLKSTEFENSGRKVLKELLPLAQIQAFVGGKTGRPLPVRPQRHPYLPTDDRSYGSGPRKPTLPESFDPTSRQRATVSSLTKEPRPLTIERAIPARLPIRLDQYPEHRVRSVVVPNAPPPPPPPPTPPSLTAL